jgi:hypothetical protein
MYNKDRGYVVSKGEVTGILDRKRINEALDKHLEKSSPSTSRGFNGKDKDRLVVPSTSSGKQSQDPRKNKASDGGIILLNQISFCCFFSFMVYVCLNIVS